MTAPPVCLNSCLAHQLVAGDTHRQREPQPFLCLSPDPSSYILGWPEKPAGASEVEKGMTVAAGFDGGGKDSQDLMQCA
jgi:hypothetical protein